MGISGVGLRAAAKPNVFGDGRGIFSCNSFAKDCVSCCWRLQGPKGGLGCEQLRGGLEDLVPDTYKKTSWWAESRVGCRLTQCFELLDFESSSIVSVPEVSHYPRNHHDLDYLLGHRQGLRL